MDYVPAGGPYVRFLYNHAVDVVIAISEGVRAALLQVGVRDDRIRVVPSGIDPAALAAPPGARRGDGERPGRVRGERRRMAARGELAEQRRHLRLAPAPPALGVDVQDAESSLRHGAGPRRTA